MGKYSSFARWILEKVVIKIVEWDEYVLERTRRFIVEAYVGSLGALDARLRMTRGFGSQGTDLAHRGGINIVIGGSYRLLRRTIRNKIPTSRAKGAREMGHLFRKTELT